MGTMLTNKEFAATNDAFKSACEAHSVKPTARQASKWRRGRGLARGVGRDGRGLR